jgi:hypothetical protein
MRVSASFAGSVRQLNDLNRQAMESTLADARERWSTGKVERPALAFSGTLPSEAATYASGLWSIFNATATNMLQAMTGSAARLDADAPTLVLTPDAGSSALPASGAATIVDPSGATLARVRK